MQSIERTLSPARIAGLWTMLICILSAPAPSSAAAAVSTNSDEFVLIANGKITLSPNGAGRFHVRLVPPAENPVPFSQAAVKQSTAAAQLGPKPDQPYFTVRFAMPIPPSNASSNVAALTGIDPLVFTHNHSPGFEILPNGDALAIYFSTPPGKAEADVSTSFVQARLRYGSEEWDLPELFFKTENCNDQSGLLW